MVGLSTSIPSERSPGRTTIKPITKLNLKPRDLCATWALLHLDNRRMSFALLAITLAAGTNLRALYRMWV
jgi:hypothetical protein